MRIWYNFHLRKITILLFMLIFIVILISACSESETSLTETQQPTSAQTSSSIASSTTKETSVKPTTTTVMTTAASTSEATEPVVYHELIPFSGLTVQIEQEDPGAVMERDRPICAAVSVLYLRLQNDSANFYYCDGSYSFEKYDESSASWQPYSDPAMGKRPWDSTAPIRPNQLSYRVISVPSRDPGIYRVWVVDRRYACEFELVDLDRKSVV